VVLEHPEKEVVHELEELLISESRRRGVALVNIASGGVWSKGVPRSAERLAKQAASYRETMASDPERKAAKDAAIRAAAQDPQRRAKLSAANTGKIFSEEHRRNIALSRIGKTPWNKGLKKCKG
jgi:hypothetical protein